ELYVIDNVLYQKPVAELYQYFAQDKIQKSAYIKEDISFEGMRGECYRLLITLENATDFTVTLRKGDKNSTTISYQNGLITFNRENSGHLIKGSKLDGNCNIRYCKTEGESKISMEIFSDNSSIELIANERYCMSNTVYPYPDCIGISFSSASGCKADITFAPFTMV
ncbi:MAG: hypothetical protein EOM87_04500, partial [Clostridia bacterium]|nr:hypothetical protein [Clostridia bacterium]